jgi:hypothetical protein
VNPPTLELPNGLAPQASATLYASLEMPTGVTSAKCDVRTSLGLYPVLVHGTFLKEDCSYACHVHASPYNFCLVDIVSSMAFCFRAITENNRTCPIDNPTYH